MSRWKLNWLLSDMSLFTSWYLIASEQMRRPYLFSFNILSNWIATDEPASNSLARARQKKKDFLKILHDEKPTNVDGIIIIF